jgi:hypothetical protein
MVLLRLLEGLEIGDISEALLQPEGTAVME